MSTTVRGEAARKAIHVGLSLVAAAVVWTLPPVAAAVVLASATAAALTVELARRASAGFDRLFRTGLGPLLRDREDRRLTGATTLSIAYTTTAVLLPGTPALAGILFAGLADAVAAVVGRRFGRHRYPGGKSLEGSAAFFVVVVALALALPHVGLAAALTVAALLTVVEAPTLRVDDNLYLPLAGAVATRIALWLTGPTFFS